MIILGNPKRDWNSCKRELKGSDLMDRLASIDRVEAEKLVEPLEPLMMEKKFMDPDHMATVHLGAGALCEYIIALYNLGRKAKGLDPISIKQEIKQKVSKNNDWITIPL
jgi:hypothetical protein